MFIEQENGAGNDAILLVGHDIAMSGNSHAILRYVNVENVDSIDTHYFPESLSIPPNY
ncbi:hypothetical protein M3629_23840 [Paenibacillus polysaccharolyticus]|nr:hypothetical protein [Paenibacillus polysaccharolyticus]